jgi:hypothetical protein
VGRSCEDYADDARHSGMEGDLTFRFQAEHLELHAGTILAKDQMRNHSNHFLCTFFFVNTFSPNLETL